VTISPQFPDDVCILQGFPGVPFPFFDDFSWRSLVAMVWPALAEQRGVPDGRETIGASNLPLVFETLKADWEVFQPQGADPSDWELMTGMNPCGASLKFGDMVLAAFSKFENLGQAGFGNLVGPLITQTRTYTRYLTAFNQVEFSSIQAKKLYLPANLNNVTFAPDAQGNNPIDVKSAWIDMTGVPHPERYHTRVAWLLDAATGKCSETTVGLVGLHIVTKTKSRPQWIWSTFEQVDNVPGAGAVAPFTYNDGTPAPMPKANPVGFPPPSTPPAPFNVTRVQPIAGSTDATNVAYQQALAAKGSGVWQFYKLVMTQWPVPADAPSNPGTPPFSFPGAGASSAFSNVTMETFDQSTITKGCMNCHNGTRTQTDFLWALALNAFPSPLGTGPSQPQLRDLHLAPPGGSISKLRSLLSQ
jgi:hypothetical protein